jgi:hypothetical protein
MDSDTLTLVPVDEVIDAYRRNQSFTLGTPEARLATFAEATRAVRRTNSRHVQIVAERGLSQLKSFGVRWYVRGCSAFAGFAQGAFTRAQAESFSHAMIDLIGAKWREWGSEQVTSNLAVASSPDPILLPHPKSATFTP